MRTTHQLVRFGCWIFGIWSLTTPAFSADTPPAKDAASGAPAEAMIREAGTVGSTPGFSQPKPTRIREGSKLIDQLGEFQKSGDQLSFFPKDLPGGFRVLENLALERVMRVSDDNPSLRVWSVTGVVTEFRGDNYLLITRAVLKAKAATNPSSLRSLSEPKDP